MTVGAALETGPRRVLHAGCGNAPLPEWLAGSIETRLDINPACEPDIVASLSGIGDIGPFDIVYCSHSLEHLYPHDVPRALAGFLLALSPGGYAVVLVPDLEDVRPTGDVLYVCDGGPICGLDLFYGHGAELEANPAMAHHSGFVSVTLKAAMETAGFQRVTTHRLSDYNLMAVGHR